MNGAQTKTLSLQAAYAFAAAHGLQSEASVIQEMEIEWDSSYTSSLRRGYIVALFEERGLFNEFKKQHWSFGDSSPGERMRARFLRIKGQYEDFLAGRGPEFSAESEGTETFDQEQTLQFALEAHLRDFLAKNLEHIEKGLTLFASSERNGIEYAVDGGRIDLLAIDQKKNFVVIELKLSQGRNKALGQLLYYMGWVDKHLGGGPCRGLIIANNIDEKLSIAVSHATGVSLAKYRMNFSIEHL